MDERDRDAVGRARNARPRDALGRPLPYGSDGVANPELAQLEQADEDTLLDAAQRLLDEERPFEAHELLEAAWKRAPAAEGALWRALAQLAVGMTHRLRGNDPGARALFERGALGLEALPGPQLALAQQKRIDVPGLAAAARRLVAGQADRLKIRPDA